MTDGAFAAQSQTLAASPRAFRMPRVVLTTTACRAGDAASTRTAPVTNLDQRHARDAADDPAAGLRLRLACGQVRAERARVVGPTPAGDVDADGPAGHGLTLRTPFDAHRRVSTPTG